MKINLEIPHKYEGMTIFGITCFFVLFLFLILKTGWFLLYYAFAKAFLENEFLVQAIFYMTWILSVSVISIFSFVIMKTFIKKTIRIFSILVVSFILFSVFTASTTMLLLPSKGLIDDFQQTHSVNPISNYIDDISEFIVTNVEYTQWGFLKIDDLLLRVNFLGISYDYQFLSLFGIDRTDIILYQGHGSCGENAMLIQELLLPISYETRLAMYINQDHMWCEIYFNNQWQIIDVGHGFLGKFQPLIVAKTSSSNATGVLIMLSNGTWVDDSIEHGFE